jgi:hypothetical protein
LPAPAGPSIATTMRFTMPLFPPAYNSL